MYGTSEIRFGLSEELHSQIKGRAKKQGKSIRAFLLDLAIREMERGKK